MNKRMFLIDKPRFSNGPFIGTEEYAQENDVDQRSMKGKV